MCYWLRGSEEPFGLTYSLQRSKWYEIPFATLFSAKERKTIAKFLMHVHQHFKEDDAEKALDCFWGRYL
jgi:hypothetical protein